MKKSTEKENTFRSLKSLVSLSVFTLVLMSAFFVFAQNQAASSYTGEQVFRGVFMGEGAVADLFPEIWKNQKNNRTDPAWVTLKEQVISEINTNDPNFMGRFGVEMQSGDHLRIDAILTEARTKMQNAQNSSQEAQEVKEESDREAGNVKVRQDVLVIDEAIVITKYIWAWTAVISANSPENVNSSRLYQESITDLVADRLAL